MMSQLTPRERALVSLGAAMGSNCIACIEYHIPASRTAGLADAEISEAIELADKLRQVPARKTLEAAANLLSGPPRKAAAQPCCG
jgi:4-carboxymuconolactone decarboxylase